MEIKQIHKREQNKGTNTFENKCINKTNYNKTKTTSLLINNKKTNRLESNLNCRFYMRIRLKAPNACLKYINK